MVSAKAEIAVAFDSQKYANAIYNALKPEIHDGPTDRAEVNINLEKNIVKLYIKAADSTSLRASVNTYSRWINMTKTLMEV